ncbi:MAG: hypothetical protein AABW80_00665 [Nanoarchaeota archaeon]
MAEEVYQAIINKSLSGDTLYGSETFNCSGKHFLRVEASQGKSGKRLELALLDFERTPIRTYIEAENGSGKIDGEPERVRQYFKSVDEFGTPRIYPKNKEIRSSDKHDYSGLLEEAFARLVRRRE